MSELLVCAYNYTARTKVYIYITLPTLYLTYLFQSGLATEKSIASPEPLLAKFTKFISGDHAAYYCWFLCINDDI